MADWHDIRERLERLTWGEGLYLDDIRAQAQNLPRQVLDRLPPDYQFRNASEVMAYLARIRADESDLEIGTTGEPRLWGDSPTAGGIDVVDQSPHGVGSGTDSGYTGGGSVQTGVDRMGTTYGDARPDVGDPGVSEQGLGAPQ